MNVNSIPCLQFFARTAGFSIGIERLPANEITSLYGKICREFSKEFPEKFKESDAYFIRNDETDLNKQISLAISDNQITLVWGKDIQDEEALGYLNRICKVVGEETPRIVDIIQNVDSKYFFDFEATQNHYQIIHELFYSKSILNNIVTNETLYLDNDISYRLQIDEERMVLVSVTGGHSNSKIVRGKLDKKRFRVSIGIAQWINLENKSLIDLLRSTITEAARYVENEAIPKLILPIAKAMDGK